MSNTRDTIGDQATVDGLVNHTLTALEEDGVTTLGNYALKGNTALQSVNFPNCTNTGTYAFQNCTALETANLPVATTIGNYTFDGCKNLKTLTAPIVTTLNQYALQNCKSLNSLTMSGIRTVGNYAFANTGIGSIILPVCTSLGTYTGQGSRTSLVDLTNNIAISANKFNGAASLAALILRSSSLCSLTASALTGTAIANGIGYIYVPTDLLDTYKAASNWSTYASQIVDISEYPKQLQDETITDTWAEILAAESDGTYTTKYSVGDIKYVDVGGTQVAMQIVAMDADALADNSGSAKITWISKGLLDTTWMNPTNTTANGWAACSLRAWLRSVIYPQIETTVRGAIKEVTKTYKDVTTNSTLSIADTVWIPSMREIYGGSSYENSGADYTALFAANADRIKRTGLGATASSWWLRSATGATSFYIVSIDGSSLGNSAGFAYGVALGFCT